MAEYASISVHFFTDPKVVRCSASEQTAFIRLFLFSHAHGTRGHVEPESLGAIGVRPAQMAKLESVGLIERNGNGWYIRRFTKWQLPPEKLEARREKARKAAQARWSE